MSWRSRWLAPLLVLACACGTGQSYVSEADLTAPLPGPALGAGLPAPADEPTPAAVPSAPPVASSLGAAPIVAPAPAAQPSVPVPPSAAPAHPLPPLASPAIPSVVPPARCIDVRRSARADGLIWSDEFDGLELDPAVWTRSIHRSAYVSRTDFTAAPANAHLDGRGSLVLTALRPATGEGNWTSAQLTTRCAVDVTYGYLEARIKMPPAAAGSWVAFWAMPTDAVYGGWPHSGELDIIEWLGVDPGRFHFGAHWGAGWNHPSSIYSSPPAPHTRDLSYDYHLYALNWTSSGLSWSIDGVRVGEMQMAGRTFAGTADGRWPFNQRFFLILNQMIDGWGGPPDKGLRAASVLVDYVRIYAPR